MLQGGRRPRQDRLQQASHGRVARQHEQPMGLAVVDRQVAQHEKDQHVGEPFQHHRRGAAVAPGFAKDQVEHAARAGVAGIVGAQHQHVGQGVGQQVGQAGAELEEAAGQPGAVRLARQERPHLATHRRGRSGRIQRRQRVRQVAQEEHAVAGHQRQRRLARPQVDAATAVQDQVETGAGPAAGAGRPIAAVLPQVIQAGLHLQARQQQGVDGGLIGVRGGRGRHGKGRRVAAALVWRNDRISLAR